MTDTEQREAARQFINRWKGRGREDEEGRSYWIDLLANVLGMENVTERLNFEKKVVVDGNTKRIDVYIPETRVIIEQKSLGKALDHKIRNSGEIDLTPFEQADRYNGKLTFDERARWIVTCNFSEIWIYDMNQKQPEPIKIALEELQNKYPMLDFLVKKDVQKISHEMEVSIKAGDIVGLIYEGFLKQYKIVDEKNESEEQRKKREHKLKSLNALCVRLVFCLYAEDAGIFGKREMFHDYLEDYDVKDCRRALIELFKVLDTPISERDEYLEEDLAQFPYVNGGLFADETIEIPQFTEEIKEMLLTKASADFDWRDISPTIFGAVFESTLNPETRRSGGMHYTSIENIHKVIDPLFLNDLNTEFEELKNRPVAGGSRTKGLKTFQKKLASLTFLDPACGSGNFLTESYLSLRRLENKVIQELDKERIAGQVSFVFVTDEDLDIQVSIQQFYGIEINDFAVTVAKTALWIAESQMLNETKSLVYGFNDEFLPLKTYVNIIEDNALQIDWNDVIAADKLSYIMGNPPFVGARIKGDAQRKDIERIFSASKNIGSLDYVSCWYKKATDMMKGANIRTALVSTNSICQGEQAAALWEPLFQDGVHIDFAYRTFRWDSEAKIKAHVHCIIVGFSVGENEKPKEIYIGDEKRRVSNINGYLLDAENIFVENRNKPLCEVSKMGIGNKPIDGGFYLFKKDEMQEFIKKEPESKKYFHPWYGAHEFINRDPRYCLWLGDCDPSELRKLPECMKRVQSVKEYRLASTSTGTVKLAERPTHFHVENMPQNEYIIIPRHSSEKRRYIPMGFMEPDNLCGDANLLLDASIYYFGILMSNIHNSWVRAVCGRIKSDYRYSANVVYNNFPWPDPSERQKERIEKTAQEILDARALYPESSLADLYDPCTMPDELRKAHIDNDRAVMAAYGFSTRMSEAECVAELMKMYQKLVMKK